VLEVSVAGIPDPIRGEAPKAWVVLRPGAQLSAQEITAWCEEALVYYKVPVLVEFRDSLPRTLVGKVLRRELVRQHLEGV
jgi:long-chain acyl-CoA synthetase